MLLKKNGLECDEHGYIPYKSIDNVYIYTDYDSDSELIVIVGSIRLSIINNLDHNSVKEAYNKLINKIEEL